MEIVGNLYPNKRNEYFLVTRFVRSDSKNRYYEVLFIATNYKNIVTKSQIKQGSVKDRFRPSVANVGYLGNTKASRGDRYYSVWHNMINRCYNPNSTEYFRYGALGVTVCDRWKCFEYFRNDIIFVENYNEYNFLNGYIYLDKDKKQIDLPYNFRVYSLQTCTFLSADENNQYNSQHYTFKAIDPQGNEFISTNISLFCKEYNLDTSLVYNTINNHQYSTHNGWRFYKI